MTHEALIAALGPGRLPQGWGALQLTDILALIGIGLICAVPVALMLRPVLDRRPSRAERIRHTRGLPAEARLLAIARILGHLPSALRAAAYGAAPPPPDAEIERIALRSRRGRRG